MSSDVDIIVMIGFLLYGLYCLFTAYRLHKTQGLFDSKILYPPKCDKDDCIDAEGFRAYMKPRLAGLGSALVLIGIYLLIAGYITVPEALSIAVWVFVVLVLLWGILFYRRAVKRFW